MVSKHFDQNEIITQQFQYKENISNYTVYTVISVTKYVSSKENATLCHGCVLFVRAARCKNRALRGNVPRGVSAERVRWWRGQGRQC